jgi:methylmalonyl-CoA/ethylmalonyl-CoA epimerase
MRCARKKSFEGASMIAGLSHVSIAVPDLEAAIELLARNYGLRASAIRTNREQGVRLVYIDLGNAKIELISPSGSDSPIAKFLERNPRGGLHHFSLATHDFDATLDDLAAKGISALGGKEQRNVDGAAIAFLHPKDFLGALVELEGH